LIPGEIEAVKERRGVVSSLYKEALEGVDVEGRVSEHRAGVEQAFKNQQGIINRNLARGGIDPSSGRGLAASANLGLEKAKATALGETQIRRGAESEDSSARQSQPGYRYKENIQWQVSLDKQGDRPVTLIRLRGFWDRPQIPFRDRTESLNEKNPVSQSVAHYQVSQQGPQQVPQFHPAGVH
jgi:hypothetical protein